MKITLETAELPETEIIIRGDVTGPEVIGLLQLLRRNNSSKLVVFRDEEQFILDAGEIVYIETGTTCVNVHTARETYETRMKLFELKEQLMPQSFAQISKSTLVNIGAVRSIQAEFSGNYRIKLKCRNESLTVSRKYFKEFRAQI